MRGRILVVDDEVLLHFLWEDICAQEDFEVGGLATTSAEALDILRGGSGITGVILDYNLQGETSEAVALEVKRLGIPTKVSTGSAAGDLPEAYTDLDIISKPYRPNDMVRVLDEFAENH